MRKKTVLIALVILALGLVGTGLSTLYTRYEGTREPYIIKSSGLPITTFKVSYGFPLVWHGYSLIYKGWIPWGFPSEYWFSLESLLLDAAFWFAISFFGSFVAIKSARALNLVATARAGVLNLLAIARACVLGMKTSIILLVMSVFFIVIGVGLCLVARPYLELGLRLIGSGTFTLIATLSVMVWKPTNVRLRHGYADAPDSREV
jgi:hypothetical protein